MRVYGIAHFDGGGQAPGPVRAAAHVDGPDIHVEHVERYANGTHNTAEWNALILALRLALERGVTHLTVRGDSMLVIQQARREWKVKAAHLKPLHAEALKLAERFEHVEFKWVPREENTRADELGRDVV
ncbi:MAG: ribonuclease / adenosylcobalamin/alpha-ribazole phosphatase [Thermoleophilaceae bacterium]|nr:ribonuclease / adenosylcobalamin/alpha-ribazole phosphatase [Thermoleophilaceae bacterium]